MLNQKFLLQPDLLFDAKPLLLLQLPAKTSNTSKIVNNPIIRFIYLKRHSIPL